MLTVSNRSLRDLLEDYIHETERYEKTLRKIYTRSLEVDEELTKKAIYTLQKYARNSRRLDEIDRKLGKAAREETCLRKEIDALDTTCRRLSDQNEMYRKDLKTVIECLKSERETVSELCEQKKRLVRENEDLRYENMNLKSENINLRRKVKDYVYVKHVPVPYPKFVSQFPPAPPVGGPAPIPHY
ncbi:uncharacterized protein [Watersipora subatra]|uniref:uncharacterized protein n=1 Tax=Watersipora subatra TaxID=2589382 RepID=UPI00355B7897